MVICSFCQLGHRAIRFDLSGFVFTFNSVSGSKFVLIKVSAGIMEHFSTYLKNVRSANKESTKKEHFKDLLNRLFAGHPDIMPEIDKISAGAEKAILNIPRIGRTKRGSADSQYNNVIIEFENDLKKSGNHAVDQLREYFLGEYKSGNGIKSTLITSDCLEWRVYYPDVETLSTLSSITDPKDIKLTENETARFIVTEKNTDAFKYWLDRFLFREDQVKATLFGIEEAFGYRSPVFAEAFRLMKLHFVKAKQFGEVQVSFEQWNKYLSIAYGTFNASEDTFIIHTYLSIFSKILAYSVLTHDDFIDDQEMKAILDGTMFERFNIRNFVDHDFHQWVAADANYSSLLPVFRLMAQEISHFDFLNLDEDILKGVYQELIDLDTRKALGEYYTPDWLCARIVQELDPKPGQTILDPACGSGSFLRAAAVHLKTATPDLTPEQLCSQLYGIDIHPLSVQIAKTTLLLSVGKSVIQSKKPVVLNVYLANTVLLPQGTQSLFGDEFKLTLDRKEVLLNSAILDDMDVFDRAIEQCDQLAGLSPLAKPDKIETLSKSILKATGKPDLPKEILNSFYEIYKELKVIKEQRRDSIWKFVLQNVYKPHFLKKKFDIVVGNPPWFTYNSVKNGQYQDTLAGLAQTYNVMPDKKANLPHLEIAAIFLAHSANFFLKETTGRLAFVLPRSFLSADHHDNTRRGSVNGLKLTSVWDLKDVSPLFRIPSCVLFARYAQFEKYLPKTGLTGLSLKGNVRRHNTNWEQAKGFLTETPATWFYTKMGSATAITDSLISSSQKENAYKKEFRQGATLVPRNFYFIALNQQAPPDFEDRILNIKTSPDSMKEAKTPWNTVDFSGKIESRFLFRTAISKSILPFALHEPALVTLPVMIENDKFKLKTWEQLKSEGYLEAATWFRNARNMWETLRTEKSEKLTLNGRMNYQNGVTEQDLTKPFIVLYNSSAKDANAVVVNRNQFDLPFVVDYKTYRLEFEKEEPAYYLVAFLNSDYANLAMKPFQSSGLFGARDVSKKILDVPLPRFSLSNPDHVLLAQLGKACSTKADEWVKANVNDPIAGLKLGQARLALKVHLKEELEEIDRVLKRIIG